MDFKKFIKKVPTSASASTSITASASASVAVSHQKEGEPDHASDPLPPISLAIRFSQSSFHTDDQGEGNAPEIQGLIEVSGLPECDSTVKKEMTPFVVFLIDTSTSMGRRCDGGKDTILGIVKQSVINGLDYEFTQEGYEYAVITFSDKAKVLIKPVIQSRSDKTSEKAIELIQNIDMEEGTNMLDGLVAALTLISTRKRSNPLIIPRICLFTDGHADQSTEVIVTKLKSTVYADIWPFVGLTAIGYGIPTSVNWKLLNELVTHSTSGAVYRVSSYNDIIDTMGYVFGTISSFVSGQLKLDISCMTAAMVGILPEEYRSFDESVSDKKKSDQQSSARIMKQPWRILDYMSDGKLLNKSINRAIPNEAPTHYMITWSQLSAGQKRFVLFKLIPPDYMCGMNGDFRFPITAVLRYNDAIVGRMRSIWCSSEPSFTKYQSTNELNYDTEFHIRHTLYMGTKLMELMDRAEMNNASNASSVSAASQILDGFKQRSSQFEKILTRLIQFEKILTTLYLSKFNNDIRLIHLQNDIHKKLYSKVSGTGAEAESAIRQGNARALMNEEGSTVDNVSLACGVQVAMSIRFRSSYNSRYESTENKTQRGSKRPSVSTLVKTIKNKTTSILAPAASVDSKKDVHPMSSIISGIKWSPNKGTSTAAAHAAASADSTAAASNKGHSLSSLNDFAASLNDDGSSLLENIDDEIKPMTTQSSKPVKTSIGLHHAPPGGAPDMSSNDTPNDGNNDVEEL
jgi:hypothetical protein